eukprot:scaffold83011_cov63-Phaeocystis_antarctica.AAC.2
MFGPTLLTVLRVPLQERETERDCVTGLTPLVTCLMFAQATEARDAPMARCTDTCTCTCTCTC